MKLIIVGDYYPDIGGVTSYVHTLTKAFLKRRLGVKVIIIQTKQHIKFYVVVSKRVTIYRIPCDIANRIRFFFRGLRYVHVLIKSFPVLVIQTRLLLSAITIASMIDGVITSECIWDRCVIHSNYLSLRSLVASLVGKKRGVRVIVTTHGYDTPYPHSSIEYTLRKAVVDMATKIIVLTRIKMVLLKLLYGDDEKYVVIPKYRILWSVPM